jgi:hypothetical protein
MKEVLFEYNIQPNKRFWVYYKDAEVNKHIVEASYNPHMYIDGKIYDCEGDIAQAYVLGQMVSGNVLIDAHHDANCVKYEYEDKLDEVFPHLKFIGG